MKLTQGLGACDTSSVHQLRLFIPGRDGAGQPLPDQHERAREAAVLLAGLGGGATILPTVDAVWLDDSGEAVWERPVIVYTYADPERVQQKLPELRAFLHRLGRETQQQEIALEYDGCFYRLRDFDQD